MDNLTHSLVGLAAAKAGLEKLSPGATVLCILAANAPDVDVAVLIFRDRWSYLQHHRGLTHSIIGVSVLVFALPLAFYFADLLLARARTRRPVVRLGGLLLASALTMTTHPILDWTNNYGMRFLLPWSPRWSYGDFLFVIDPVFWLVLGGSSFLLTANTKKQISAWLIIGLLTTALVMFGSLGANAPAVVTGFRVLWFAALLTLAGLYRAKLGRHYGARLAITGLVVVTVYSLALFTIHRVVWHRANVQAAEIARGHAEQILQVAAMPTLANPNDWLCILETDRATYKFNVALVGQSANASIARFEKPSRRESEIIAAAERDRRAQVFLGFARFPGFRVIGEDCLSQTLVQFADLRYTEPGKGRGTFSLELPVDCPALERPTK
ncbi:MAG TPA: metal-dependent hydrolase [Pyrinomonadaceae bacterium]|jgi:inner membrane protein